MFFDSNGMDPLYTLGPRGERIPVEGYKGPVRPIDQYTKPMAKDHAKRGDYHAAELAEFYMCPTCHVSTQISQGNFNLRIYVNSYQENYKVGQAGALVILAPIVVTSAPALTAFEISVYLAAGETIADVGQAGVATVDVILDPNPQNAAAAGIAWADVFTGPGVGAEVATASRRDRRASSVNASSTSGEFTAINPPKRPPGIDRRVHPTREAKSWPSQTVRVHRSVDPGRRVDIPAAAKRIIQQRPAADETGPFDYGHKPGHEVWRMQKKVRAGEIGRDEFVRAQKNPDIYQLENRAINRGHKREKN